MVGPLDVTEVLTVNDFELLEKLTMSQYGEKLVQAFHNYLDVNREDISNIALVTGTMKLNMNMIINVPCWYTLRKSIPRVVIFVESLIDAKRENIDISYIRSTVDSSHRDHL